MAAFEALIERPRRGRLLAVLGAMGELGSGAEAAHQAVGRRAAALFDAICVVASPLGRGEGQRVRPLESTLALTLHLRVRRGT